MSVALVIPGHDCGRTLRACLQAIMPLAERGDVSEIWFVADHCSDDSVAIAKTFPQARLLESPRRGAGAARNVGWRASSAELVWFVDADCVIEPDALARLLPHLSDPAVAAVGGSYANLCSGALVADLIHEEMVDRHGAMGTRTSFAITANLLCRRSVLEGLGGFDESLRLAQDLDLAYRILGSGAQLAFDASSRVGHFHETRALPYLYKQARQGYWRMHLYRRHPGRMTGDSYSGASDYVQPPVALLGGLGLTAALLRLPAPLRLLLGASSSSAALALLALQLPRTWHLLARTGDARYLAYVPFGMARALFRGAGMLAGATQLALGTRSPTRAGAEP